jgi:putative two-component system hydrogenase maturation factor HypX/HoxX
MRVLLLASAANSLTQRVDVELRDAAHHVGLRIVANGDEMIAAVDQVAPDVIVAPYLKRRIPESIWRAYTCLVLHPGIKGDRGPSSLDWAILQGKMRWGVTVLQACAEFDAGDVWAHREFPMRPASKSALYRHEVADASLDALGEALRHFASGSHSPEPLDYGRPDVQGRLELPMSQSDRAIDWAAPTEVALRKLRCSDSSPGVLDGFFGQPYYLFGGHEEGELRGSPGRLLAQRDGAVCRATGDGAVWISHVKRAASPETTYFKLPASNELALHLHGVPELTISPADISNSATYREIWYEERNAVGYLHFDFYNGAMSTEQCRKLRDAYIQARRRPTRVMVLMAGADLWSNGLNLNTIEAAADPEGASWANINALDDLVREIIITDSHLVISAMAGNAGAGGVMLALAADCVHARHGIVLNPHYKGMGLSGSEYWTYLLPRRVGITQAIDLTEECRPISTRTAKAIGLIDDAYGTSVDDFRKKLRRAAESMVADADLEQYLRMKHEARVWDEGKKPLDNYRDEELAAMAVNFKDSVYHERRQSFVYKQLVAQSHPSPKE